jgi:hypothetical protein
MNRKDLYKFVMENHGKKKNREMAVQCHVTLGQIETIKTSLIKKGLIEPTRARVDSLISKITERPKAEIGCREGEARQSIIMKKEIMNKIKAIAHYDRKKIKELIENIFEEYLKNRSADLPEALRMYTEKNES